MKALLRRNKQDFIPPFCPNPKCQHHQKPIKKNWWNKLQPYPTKLYGMVPRFYCRTCGRTFSLQTFKLNYYCKKLVNYRTLHHLNSESVSIRGLSRFLGVSPACVTNRTLRLGRQNLALHSLCLQMISGDQDVAIDGLVSFDVSQYFPNNLTIAVTAESLLILEVNHCTLRRSGRMTEAQKKKREQLDKAFSFEKGALSRSFREVLDFLFESYPRYPERPMVLITDEKKEYERAFRKHALFKDQAEGTRCVHHRINSQMARNKNNHLQPCNYMEREIRKDLAAHRRETVCHCRNVNNGILRLWCYAGWHNYWKSFPSASSPGEGLTHGELAGISAEVLMGLRETVYEDRAFLSRINLSPSGRRAWLMDHPTPLKRGHDYVPAFAAA